MPKDPSSEKRHRWHSFSVKPANYGLITSDEGGLPYPYFITSITAQRVLGVLLSLIVLASFSVRPTQAQTLPFYDSFNDGDFTGWEVIDDVAPVSGPSDWRVEGGVLVQRSNIWSYSEVELETKYHLGTHIITGDSAWTDYSFNATVRSTDNDGVGLIFRYQDAQNYYRILLMNDPAWSGRDMFGTPFNAPLQRIQKFVDGEPIILAENKVAEAYPSGFFALTADVRGDTIQAFLNGKRILRAIDDTYRNGRIGLLSYANTGAHYDSIAVTTERLIYDTPPQQLAYPVREDRAPYIQNPTQTSIEIAWRSLAATTGRVTYADNKDLVNAQEIIEPEARQKHHVRLEGLQPSTRYYYEVYSGDVRVLSEEPFRTAPHHTEHQFSFLVLGDSGVDTPTQWAVGEQMRRSMDQAEVDFVVHVGDVHQGAGDYYDDIYFKPYRNIIKNVNVFTALGNHDVITDNGAVYLDDFYLPSNNPDSTERYYSFRWANAYFICLDTNIDYGPGSPQHRWLLSRLQDPLRQSAMWTFVYAHHPPYTEYWTNYFGDQGVQDHLVPLFEQYDVDMVMNGHTHSYERGEQNHVHYLVSGGGGGGLDDFFIDYDHISFSSKTHHFTRIDVNDDQLTVTAIDQSGQRVDRFLVNKFTTINRDPISDLPVSFDLQANYPNPFIETTTFTYSLAASAHVQLSIYDTLGRYLTTLVDHHHLAGTYTLQFDAKRLAAGSYQMRMTAGAYTTTQTFTVVR